MRRAPKHRKTREFLAVPGGSAAGKDTARGPLAGFMRLTPDSRAPAKADPSARAGVGVVVVVGPMLALFGRRFAPVLALGWPM